MSPFIIPLALGAMIFLTPSKKIASQGTKKGSSKAASVKTSAKAFGGLSGQRIFLLGDSLSMLPSTPGGKLAAILRASGAKVEVNAIGGRSSFSFLSAKGNCDYPQGKKGPKRCDGGDGAGQLATMLKSFKPTVALVMLGTNDTSNVSVGGSESAHLAAFTKIINQLEEGGAKVIGIGPPAFPTWDQPHGFKNAKGEVYASADLRKASAAFVPKLAKLYDNFIDSRPLTEDLTSKAARPDGIHFHAGATKWAERLAEKISKLL